MGHIVINNVSITPQPTQAQRVSVSYKLTSAPETSSSYTLVTTNLFIEVDGTLRGGPLYINNLIDSTSYTVRLFNDCTATQKDIISTAGAGQTSTTTTVLPTCDFRGVSGLISWIDFSDLSTQKISKWRIRSISDKSGNNNGMSFFHIDPFTAIGYNGLRGARFDGNAKMQTSTTFSNDSSFTIISVGDLPVTRGSDNNGLGWSIITNDGNAKVVFTQYGTKQYNAGTYNNPGSQLMATTIKNVNADSRVLVYDNGHLVNDSGVILNNKFRGSSYGFILGSSGNFSTPDKGLIHELLIFNRVLSIGEIESINVCLREKYDIPNIPMNSTSTTTTNPLATTTTTSTTTTSQPPAQVFWEFYENEGDSYTVLTTGVNGSEELVEDHPTTEAGSFPVYAGNKVRARVLSNSSNPPNQYYLKITNLSTSVVLFEATSPNPIDYTTIGLSSAQQYLITMSTNIVATTTTTSTTTTQGPSIIDWNFDNLGPSRSFYNVKSGLTGSEDFQAYGSFDSTGSFILEGGNKIFVGLFDDSNDVIDSDYYYIKIENTTDSVIIFERTTSLPQTYISTPILQGKNYVITMIVNRTSPITTSTTTTTPCNVITDIEASETFFIIDGLGNNLDSDSSDIIKYQ